MALSRRTLVTATALLPVGCLTVRQVADAPHAHAAPARPAIRPRDDWAGDLAPKGSLADEEDVRFLLIHHTLTPNGDAAERIPERLRSIYRFHTSADRGWADVAYNFFVDAHGTIWEGRAGSLTRPIRGDATGGSQGFALLCCFIGDFTAQPPTPAAMDAMTRLLAWLAAREGLDLATPLSFTSRGSSKWRRGIEVTTDQVAGHRDMSATECPGDALYPLVRERLLPDARALLVAPTPTPTLSPSPDPQPTATPDPGAAGGGPTASGAPGGGAVPEGALQEGALPEGVLRAVGGGALVGGVAGVLATVFGRRGRGSGAQQLGDDDGAPDRERGEQAQQEPDHGA